MLSGEQLAPLLRHPSPDECRGLAQGRRRSVRIVVDAAQRVMTHLGE